MPHPTWVVGRIEVEPRNHGTGPSSALIAQRALPCRGRYCFPKARIRLLTKCQSFTGKNRVFASRLESFGFQTILVLPSFIKMTGFCLYFRLCENKSIPYLTFGRKTSGRSRKWSGILISDFGTEKRPEKQKKAIRSRLANRFHDIFPMTNAWMRKIVRQMIFRFQSNKKSFAADWMLRILKTHERIHENV